MWFSRRLALTFLSVPGVGLVKILWEHTVGPSKLLLTRATEHFLV